MSKKKKDSDNMDKWLEHGTDPERNTVLINGEIDGAAADRVLSAFHLFDPNKPVLVILNSEGGSEFSGLAIYDTIKAHPSEVTIRVMGEASSMAAVILQAGDVRQASPHSTIMTHIGSWGVEGTHKKNAKRYLQHSEKMDKILDQIMLSRVNEKHSDHPKTMEWWSRREQFDNWMMAAEALELGLIDEIYDPIKA